MTVTCAVSGCPERPKSRGWCAVHYARWRRHGDPTKVTKAGNQPGRGCSVEGCVSRHASHGYCGAHYMRWKKYGDPLRLRERPYEHELPCTIEGCENRRSARGWCARHWKAWRVYGDPLMRKHRIRGEGTINDQGYRLIRMPDHPNANVNGYIHEHRLVMSERIGRPLLPGENVHHKNGNRADNRLENLELWVTIQPSGQRPEELVRWAREILARYEHLPPGV